MAKRSEPKPANAEDNSQTGKIAIVALAALGLAIKSRVARSKADAKPFVTRLPTATNSTPGASSSVDKSPSGRALRSPLRPRDSSTRDHAAEGLALIELEARGVIAGGMIPKVEAAVAAAEARPAATVKIAAGDVDDPVASALLPDRGTLVGAHSPEIHHA